MRVSASVRALCAFVRLGLLAFAFVGLAFVPVSAQSCGANCGAIIYAGDVHDDICFNLNPNEASCPSGIFPLHISFGQTVDWFQPSGVQLFDAHTASSGSCPSGTCGYDSKFRAPGGAEFSNTMTSLTDYKVTFDGRDLGGGALGVGTYPFFCEPHGSSMTGTIVVDPDGTSTALGVDINPSVAGQTVTFTATVSNTTIASITPTGTVQFFDGATPISSALTLISGSRSFATSLLSAGSHTITALYSPDVNSFSASSSIVFQNVRDFSIAISNPDGSVLPGVNYDYSGTLTAIDGYPAAVNISCVNGSTTPPGNCVLLSPTNPVPMGSAFTVRASNATPASTFNFNIQAASNSGFSLIHSFPVSLNVGNFSFAAPNPTSVNVPQGNPSTPIALQVISQGSFSGEVDMSCVSPPAGVTCVFSNGSATDALSVGQGATVNDTLVLNTTSSVTVGAHPVTVQATPAASPSQFQQQTVTLNETTGAGPASVTLVYFGPVANQGWPNGPTFQYLPTLVGVGAPYSFKVTVVDYSNYNNSGGCTGAGACDNSTGVQLLITFSEPMAADSAIESFPGGNGDSCVTQSSTAILCNLNTITYTGSFYREVTVNVVPPFGRKANVTASVSTTDPNPGYPNCNVAYANSTCTVIETATQTRPRPMVRPGQKPGNTNPK